MPKIYRQCNGLMTNVRDSLYCAYDKGYKQAETDYKKPEIKWERDISSNRYLQFRCSGCGFLSYANYPYCPWCGCPNEKHSR